MIGKAGMKAGKREKPHHAAFEVVDFIDGPCWARTSDPLIKSQLLYQLS